MRALLLMALAVLLSLPQSAFGQIVRLQPVKKCPVEVQVSNSGPALDFRFGEPRVHPVRADRLRISTLRGMRDDVRVTSPRLVGVAETSVNPGREYVIVAINARGELLEHTFVMGNSCFERQLNRLIIRFGYDRRFGEMIARVQLEPLTREPLWP